MRFPCETMTSHARPFPSRTAFAAAALIFAAVGAASGQAIGDTPIIRKGTGDTLPSANVVADDYSHLAGSERPPDHYPLVTPDGTIPVGELALHGRMRDRDEGWYATEDTVLLEARYDDDMSESEIDRLAHEEPVVAMNDPVETAPEDRAQPDAPETVRIVDVPSALAEEQQL